MYRLFSRHDHCHFRLHPNGAGRDVLAAATLTFHVNANFGNPDVWAQAFNQMFRLHHLMVPTAVAPSFHTSRLID